MTRYNTKGIQSSIKVECPRCHFILGAADILSVDSKNLGCQNFVMVTSFRRARLAGLCNQLG
jgi:hypothetical protein